MLSASYYRWLFFIALVVSGYLFFQQGEHSGINFPHLDKIAHFIVFAGLTLLVDLAFRLPLLICFVLLTGYGISVELVQGYLPQRDASIADIIADMAGIVSYLLLHKPARTLLVNPAP